MIGRVAITMLCALAIAFAARAEDPLPTLEKNPFVRPAFLSDRGPPPAVADEIEPEQPLNLRGVLLSGAASLVNVDGRIVGLGEEVAGYRLESVGETHAVFSRDGQDLRIPLPGSVGGDSGTVAEVEVGNDDS